MASDQELPVVTKEFAVDHLDPQQFPSLPASTTPTDHKVSTLTSSAWSKRLMDSVQNVRTSKMPMDSTDNVEEIQKSHLATPYASGHANPSTTTKNEKVLEMNGRQRGHSVEQKDDDEHQVTTIGEFDVQLRVGEVDNPSLHSGHQLHGYLSADDANSDQNTGGHSRDELQDQKDASNQADEKNDSHSEEPLGDHNNTKEKVAEGQISHLTISEKRDDIPTIQRPTRDSDIELLTEEKMTAIVKEVLEKERVNILSVRHSNEKEFVLDEQMFPSLASIPTQTRRPT